MIFKSAGSYNKRRRKRRQLKNFFLILLLFVALPLGIFAYKPIITGVRTLGSGLFELWNRQPISPADSSKTVVSAPLGKKDEKPNTPKDIKAVYLSQDKLVNQGLEDTVLSLKSYDVNAVVIDVKTAEGILPYSSGISLAQNAKAVSETPIPLSNIVNRLKENGFYTIGRIICFKDNKITLKNLSMTVQAVGGGQWWYNYQKYLNPHVEAVWEYLADIGSEAADMGFDEVMLDELSFPDKGALELIDYGEYKNASKSDAVNGFISYITDILHKKKIMVSVSLPPYAAFDKESLQSGLDIDFSVLKADYISPHFELSSFKRSGSSTVTMGEAVYKGAEKNYEPILSTAVSLTGARLKENNCPAVLRPWIQAYNSGGMVFSREIISSQIKICLQNGAGGYLLFNDKGEYPLKPEHDKQD